MSDARQDPRKLAERLAKVPGLDAKSFDPSISPADDLDRFTNGNWGTFNQLGPHTQQNIRTSEGLVQILEEMGEKVQRGEATPGTTQYFVGMYYLAGRNRDQRNAVGAKPLEPLLNQIAQIGTQRDFLRVLARLHKQGFSPFWGIETDPGSRSIPTSHGPIQAAVINPWHSDTLPFFRHPSRTQHHIQTLVAMLSLAGVVQERALTEARDSINVGDNLSPTSQESKEIVASLRAKPGIERFISVSGLSKRVPQLDFTTYFDELGMSTDQLQCTIISPSHIQYFKRLAELTSNVPLTALKSYLRVILISKTVRWLGDRSAGISTRVEKRYQAKTILEDAEVIGLRTVLEQMYAQRTVTDGMRHLVRKVDDDVRKAFEQLINSADWLSKQARRNAIARQRKIRLEVGYEAPVPSLGQNSIEGTSYLSLALTFLQEHATVALQKVGKPLDLRPTIDFASTDLH